MKAAHTAPLHTQDAMPHDSPVNNESFLARQPIVDLRQEIIGYELLFRHSSAAHTAHIGDAMRADANILENLLTNMGTDWLLGDKHAFVNISPSLLKSEFLDLLPAEHLVLELPDNLPAPAEYLDLCRQLRAKGYRFALDNFSPDSASRPLLEIADYVKIDVQSTCVEQLSQIIAIVPTTDRVIATKVETGADYWFCKGLGIGLFEGYYFAKPETLTAKTLNPSLAHVLELLNKVRMNAEIGELEQVFKLDVALSYKLLRFINSAALRRRTEVHSIRTAINLLGYQQLYRWLTLLLVTSGEGSVPPALMRTAITRGRLTELLGQGRLGPHEGDNLFIAGVFSLLDTLLDMPMENILERLSLPQPICEALLFRHGLYGPYLTLAEACETGDGVKITALSRELALEPPQINQLHLDALVWVEKLGA